MVELTQRAQSLSDVTDFGCVCFLVFVALKGRQKENHKYFYGGPKKYTPTLYSD